MNRPEVFRPDNVAIRVRKDVLYCEHCKNIGYRCSAQVTTPVTGSARRVIIGLHDCCKFEYDESLEQIAFEF